MKDHKVTHSGCNQDGKPTKDNLASRPALISIDPSLKCKYLGSACSRMSNKALIWTHALLPTGWVMMPVCGSCLSTALMLYPPQVGPGEDTAQAVYYDDSQKSSEGSNDGRALALDAGLLTLNI